MPLQDGIEEIVTIVTSYLMDGGKELTNMYGDQAPQLASEISALLEARLMEDTPYGSLWVEYKENPVDNEAELIGALEVLEEATPELTIRLEGYYAAFQQLDQPGVQTLVETSEPENTINIEEIKAVRSIDDMDDNDEYREENTYLVGNVEDRSTSAMYIEGLDTSVEPNQSEDTVDTSPDED
jgi:hypothetical protein